MEVIDQDAFEKAAEKVKGSGNLLLKDIVPENLMTDLINDMSEPIKAQKVLASQVRYWLERQMETDVKEFGRLTNNTRQWIETYNNILNNLQKNQFGDKSVNLDVRMITHSDIGELIRKHPMMKVDKESRVIDAGGKEVRENEG